MRIICWVQRVCALAALMAQPFLLAQRGGSYESDISRNTISPHQGFPGYFDTYMADPGEMVLDLPPLLYIVPMPTSSLDYGVNEKLTIGTNLVLDTIPYLLGGFGASGKIRQLVYGSPSMQSTFTAYGGIAGITIKNPAYNDGRDSMYNESLKSHITYTLGYLHFTSNTTWYLNDKNLVTGQLALSRFKLDVNSPKDIEYGKIEFFYTLAGLAYQYFYSPRVSFNAAGTYPLIERLKIDSVGDQQTVSSGDDLFAAMPNFRFVRASIGYRTEGDWLFDFGWMHMQPLVEGALWFGAAVKL